MEHTAGRLCEYVRPTEQSAINLPTGTSTEIPVFGVYTVGNYTFYLLVFSVLEM